jgi:hypothetical protein
MDTYNPTGTAHVIDISWSDGHFGIMLCGRMFNSDDMRDYKIEDRICKTCATLKDKAVKG